MGDSQRAFAVGLQTGLGEVATEVHWLNFDEDFGHDPNLSKETPKFLTNQRWMRRKTIPTVRFDEVTLKGRVDSTEFGWFLCSAFGAPSSSGGTHTFLAGQSNSPLLTVWFLEGLTDLWWQMPDARVNKLDINMDASSGQLTYNATFRGVGATPLTGPPTVIPDVIPDNSPFAPWQTVLHMTNTTIDNNLCIASAKFSITNNYDPYYCTPVIAPTAETEAGLYPSRFTEGEVMGTWDIVYEYTGDADSAFYDFRHNLAEYWSMISTDPQSEAGLGYLPTFQLVVPLFSATKGTLDRSKPNVLQSISGEVLYDPTLGSGAEIVLINGLTGGYVSEAP